MITKCDFKGCEKAGICRAPKSRDLKEYWHFCREHAADYNKNWNYYADMTNEEIEADWERQVFGSAMKDKEKAAADTTDYINFMNDFLNGRSRFDHAASKKSPMSSKTVSAFKVLNLPITASWTEISAMYRALAKKHHPDTAKNKKTAATEFAKISDAYQTLETHFKKKKA